MPVDSRDGPALFDRPLARALLAIAVLAALLGLLFVMRAARGDDGGVLVSVDGAPTPSASAQPGDEGLGPLDSRAPLVGQPAPDFVLRKPDGSTVTLSDLRGQVVFVNFWATWCTPCRKELPTIQRIYDEKRALGFEVLTINRMEDAGTASGFFAERSLTLPILLDRDGAVYDQYKLRGLPDSFFVDRDGNIASLQYGEVTEKNIRDRLRDAGLP